MLRKKHPVFCKCIDVWRFNDFLSVSAYFSIAKIIRQYVNNIWVCWFFCTRIKYQKYGYNNQRFHVCFHWLFLIIRKFQKYTNGGFC